MEKTLLEKMREHSRIGKKNYDIIVREEVDNVLSLIIKDMEAAGDMGKFS